MYTDLTKVKQVNENIYAIYGNGGGIMYLVLGSEKALLIDTGWGIDNLGEIVLGITDLPLTVVNTHGHPDHVGGNYQFLETYVHKDDIDILKGCFVKRIRRWALDNVLKGPYPEDFSSDRWICAKPAKIIAVKHKHEFDLGDRIVEVLAVPGHSPGSIVLLDRKERVLFSGDSIIQGTIWMHLNESTSMDIYLSSLKSLKEEIGRFDTILPGHGEIMLKPEIINELISGIEDILNGSRRGTPYKSFVGDGLLCTFDNCGIVYNPAKL